MKEKGVKQLAPAEKLGSNALSYVETAKDTHASTPSPKKTFASIQPNMTSKSKKMMAISKKNVIFPSKAHHPLNVGEDPNFKYFTNNDFL